MLIAVKMKIVVLLYVTSSSLVALSAMFRENPLSASSGLIPGLRSSGTWRHVTW